jgi:hypothetical protein
MGSSRRTSQSNHEVVHPITAYAVQGNKRHDIADGIGSGLLVAYAGRPRLRLSAGRQKARGLLPLFQMHYAQRYEQSVKSSVGLVFAKDGESEIKTRRRPAVSRSCPAMRTIRS